MTVAKQPAVGTITLTEELDKAVAHMEREYPAVKFHNDLYRQKSFIDSSVSNIKRSLVEGAVFVCIILFIFLMNPRTTLISLVTIPISLLMTLLFLHIMGLTINTMSIGGIAIAIGSLVDDAIVDVENVYKRLRHNHTLPESKRRKVAHFQLHNDYRGELRAPLLPERHGGADARAPRRGLHPGAGILHACGSDADPGALQLATPLLGNGEERAEDSGMAQTFVFRGT